MAYVRIYTKTGCPYCRRAKELLEQHQMSYTEINVSESPLRLAEMLEASNGTDTAPQVFIDGRHIGGSVELERFFADDGADAGV